MDRKAENAPVVQEPGPDAAAGLDHTAWGVARTLRDFFPDRLEPLALSGFPL